jgi:flagellar hook-length control protein FliK
LDVTQIPIKINQKSQLDVGNPKSTTQMDDSANSFDQILAMFNISGQTPESNRQSAASSLQNVSDKIESDQTDDPKNLSLDSILTALVAELQLVQQSQVVSQLPPGNALSASGSQQQVVSTMLTPLQQVTADVKKALTQWLQKVEGMNQTLTVDQGQIVQRLDQLIGELQSQDNQKPIEADMGDKIKMILDELKTENKFGDKIPLNSRLHENGLLVDDIKKDGYIESKTPLSLDKNQVTFSSIANPGTNIHGASKLTRVPFSVQVEDLTKSNGQTTFISNLPPVLDEFNGSKAVPDSPTLPVSEFVPEVSAWIDRYMKITNGQSGSTEAKFSLYPEHLGHIEIKISSQQGQVSAQILTDTSMAKEALDGQLQNLKQALQQHGLLVQKLDIVQQSPVTMDSYQGNLSFSQGGSSSSHEQRNFTPVQDESKKQEEADPMDLERETLPITYGGAAAKTASLIDFTA